MKDLIALHAHLTAVKHFMAPFAAEVNTLIRKNLAVTAFAVNVWLHSHRQRDAKDALVIAQIHCQFVIFVDYVLYQAVAYVLEP